MDGLLLATACIYSYFFYSNLEKYFHTLLGLTVHLAKPGPTLQPAGPVAPIRLLVGLFFSFVNNLEQ